MSEPKIPHRNRKEIINDILESIALEETAIAHIINAEGEKIQKLLTCKIPNPDKFEDVLKFQTTIIELFDKLIEKQKILLSKIEVIKSFREHDNDFCD